MLRIGFASLVTTSLAGSPPPAQEYAATARWMVNTLDWGFLSTISTRTEASKVGDAFGNPNSHADCDNGVPYFFVSNLDASMVDVFSGTGASSRVSLAMTEAQLTGDNAIADCTIGEGDYGDPENPPCARLVLNGNLVKVGASSAEGKLAKSCLEKRHPSFRWYPPGHDFFVAKLELDGIWLIDFYGGAQNVSTDDYFATNLTTFDRPMTTKAYTAPPPSSDQVGTARWMASTMTYGVLSTVSSRSEGTRIGDAFGNPYSFVDVGGVPHVYGSNLDASMIDLFTADEPNPRASLALSEATLIGTNNSVKSCIIGTPLGDPENPPCARLVLSGQMSILDVNSTEGKAAYAALLERHPSFANYPSGHDFAPVKMEVDGIWLIDKFGGAAIIDPKDYLAGSATIVA